MIRLESFTERDIWTHAYRYARSVGVQSFTDLCEYADVQVLKSRRRSGWAASIEMADGSILTDAEGKRWKLRRAI